MMVTSGWAVYRMGTHLPVDLASTVCLLVPREYDKWTAADQTFAQPPPPGDSGEPPACCPLPQLRGGLTAKASSALTFQDGSFSGEGGDKET